MNKDYWRSEEANEDQMMVKLVEEVGEVAKEHGKLLRGDLNATGTVMTEKKIKRELEHVIFIAQQWWERL